MRITTAYLEAQRDLDRIELSLIALLNAEARTANVFVPQPEQHATMVGGHFRAISEDAWKHLRLPPIVPREPWLFGWQAGSSKILMATTDPLMLPAPLPTLLGRLTETAWYMGEMSGEGELLRYSAYKALTRIPHPYRAVVPGQYYLRCVRLIDLAGMEHMQLSLHGWSRRGAYAPVFAPGISMQQQYDKEWFPRDAATMVSTASLQAYARSRWQVRLSQTTAVKLAVDAAAMRHLAALRDNPRTESGRLRPIVHWVRAHLRRKRVESMDLVDVRKHLKGITSFPLGDIHVDVREPQVEALWPTQEQVTAYG